VSSGAEVSPSAEGRLPLAHPHAVRIGLATTAVLVIADQITKELVEAVLEPGRFVPWIGSQVGWQLIYNPGGAFGLPAPSWLFLTVTAVVLVLVAKALPRATSRTGAMAFGMLLAGALGNAIDRLVRAGDGGFGGGYVVDFVAWGSFPRFNVADSSITVGFVLLVLAMLIEERAASDGDSPGDGTTP
jgi:signal peptidase II